VRILFTTFPALGHLHPLLPLALAAQDAGHEVRLATGADLVSWASRCGVDAHDVGPGGVEVHATAARDFAGRSQTAHMFTQVWPSAALAGLVELTSSWRPELVIHEEQEYAGVLLAALLGVPCVTHSWSAPARPAAACAAQRELLDPLWQQWIPGQAARRTGDLYLDACPPPFQTDALAAIARTSPVVTVRPGTFDGPPEPPPPWLDRMPRPAAYVTQGTVAEFSVPDLLRRIAFALAAQFASVVVTTGPNPVESLGDLPPNVRAMTYVAQSLVLPHVDLLVSHGGAGGTLGALLHAVPHLVLPGPGMSQISSAAAIARIGAGRQLGPDERDGESIAQAARQLLGDPSFGAAAARVRAELAQLPGPQDVLDELSRLVGQWIRS
jgi:UDP:flavonoid glycosyltransferase YjiC (YdhE family)